jgi:hypothetical protein
VIATLERMLRVATAALALPSGLLASPWLGVSHPAVVVQGSGTDPVVARLVQELVAAGCTVRTGEPMAVEPAARTYDAVLDVTPDAIEIWVFDRSTDRAAKLDVVMLAAPRAESAAIAAVRVSEIFRAHLLPVARPAPAEEASADPARAAITTTASVPPLSRPAIAERPVSSLSSISSPPSEATLALALGPLLLLTPGGTPPALDLSVIPEWRPSRNLAIRAVLAAPLGAPSVTSREGSASVSTWLTGAGADWVLESRDTVWMANLGAGVAAAWSETRGHPASGAYLGSNASAVAAVPYVEAGGSLGTPRVRLAVDGLVGLALPEVTVVFAGNQVASWGRPVGAVSVLVQLGIL